MSRKQTGPRPPLRSGTRSSRPGVDDERLYEDKASGRRDDRPGLVECLKSLRDGDTLMVWKLDRLGRDLHHLVNTVHDLTARNIGLKVLTGQGAAIDTTTAAGKLVFGIFAALAEFERELISERTVAGLASARARGRTGGRPFTMTPAKVRLAMASMGKPDTKVSDGTPPGGVPHEVGAFGTDPGRGSGSAVDRGQVRRSVSAWTVVFSTSSRWCPVSRRAVSASPVMKASSRAAWSCAAIWSAWNAATLIRT